MKKRLAAAFLSSILIYASTIGMIGSSSALEIIVPATTTLHVTNPTVLKGSIANVQPDSDGKPEWIESGIWVLRLRPGTSDSDMPSAHLLARIAMVKIDGTAVHGHVISNFTLIKAAMEGNSTHVLEGTTIITMRDGPVSGVPLTIKIFNNAVIALWIGPDKIDSHFGTGPIYGTLAESSRATMAELYEGMAMGDRPSNATSTEQEGLERSSVNYYGNATGYLAYPKNGTDLPAVIMIHEWWGLNQNIKNMAEQLANEGYAVLAVDLYDGEVATESSRASELAGSVRNNPDEAIHNLNAAVEHVASLQTVNSSKIASLGWCFGGGQSLQLALNTERPLAATVIYYGTLVTNQTELAEITWPVLGIFGAEDQSIPVDTVNQFKAALDANAVTNEIYIYDGVGHAFANPSGGNYAPEETTDAWDKTLAFLRNYV
jgi:carboxymethylenebutenolidase